LLYSTSDYFVFEQDSKDVDDIEDNHSEFKYLIDWKAFWPVKSKVCNNKSVVVAYHISLMKCLLLKMLVSQHRYLLLATKIERHNNDRISYRMLLVFIEGSWECAFLDISRDLT